MVLALLEVFIKSQTLIPFSVPAATHYNLGLKAMEKMLDPALNSLEGAAKSLMSQMYNFLSFPPVAMYFPLGEIDTELMLASWALKVFLTYMLVFQIFNLPSHPTEAK